ncbi:MAG: DUF2207 domain-containing protein [Patescibacteria group bacterium]
MYIKLISVTLSIFAFIFLLTPTIAIGAEFENVTDFSAQIEIHDDSSFSVTETILYDFADQQRHGIFRYIPISYKARGGNYNIRISDISVTNEAGQSYNYETSYPGKNIELKIGDADILITGRHTYIISYTIEKAINYFEDWDELYWNATGNGWEIPIDSAKVKVIFPNSFSEDKLQIKCFAGSDGTDYECDESPEKTVINGTVSDVSFGTNNLFAYEGMTIVVGFPKGLVQEPTASDKFIEYFRDNGILLLPLLVLSLMIYLWRAKGRDPNGKGTIIAQYDAPDNITAAEVGTIIDEKVQLKDISSQIIQFAVNGNLKIVKGEGKTDYSFLRLTEADVLKTEFEKSLFTGIFGDKNSVKLSELKNKFYKVYSDITSKLYKETVNKNYFAKNPRNVRLAYNGLGVTLFLVGFFVGFLGAFYSLSFIISGIIVLIFSMFMPSKTIKGVQAREHILGLKTYLSVAEKDRIKFHNAPEKNPEQFDKLLPYAMVLGVEKQWANQFSDIYNKQPSWYEGPAGSNFTTLYLISSLNSFQTSTNSALVSRPSSASGGGSGFSGGGFSGGGFGGGGGGSW